MRTMRQLEWSRQQDVLSRHLRTRRSLEQLRKMNIYQGLAGRFLGVLQQPFLADGGMCWRVQNRPELWQIKRRT